MNPEQLLETARALGAEQAEVYQTTSFGRSANFEANRLKQVETGDEQGTALRVWCAGRPGLAVAHGPVEPRLLAEKAVALCAFSEGETTDLVAESVATASPAFLPTPVEQLIALGEQTIALVRERYAEVLSNCTFSEEVGTLRLVNSAGLDIAYTSYSRGGFLGAEWVRGEDFLQVYDGETVTGTLSPAAIAAPVLQRLAWAHRNGPSPRRSVPVLFTSKAAEVLLGTAMSALDGRKVLQQASPWSQSRGETVLSPLLTLAQEPELDPYVTPFDDEGTPTVALEFCTRGVLNTFYADRLTARKLGLAYTGNGLRGGLGSYPQPGLFNLTVAAGGTTFEQMVASLKDGIIVDQVLGEGAGLSGEFSVNIDLGYRVKKGEIVGRIKDTMIAGNAYEALKKIAAVGSERHWEGNLLTPALLVEGLTLTGRA